MFIKSYRKPLNSNSELNRQLWLEKDLQTAPSSVVNSLKTYFEHLNTNIVPVIQKATGVSLQYSGYSDYLIRDIGFASVFVNSLFDLKIQGGFTSKLNSVLAKLTMIDKFLNETKSSTFSAILSRIHYQKSIVIGLKRDSDSVNDIEYIEIRYDDRPDAVVSTKPFESKNPATLQRVGVKIRLYLEPEDTNYMINRERLNCISSGDDGERTNTLSDVNREKYSEYILESTEHHLTAYYDDIDSLMIKFLEVNKRKLSAKLGYNVEYIDQSVLDLIDMSLI